MFELLRKALMDYVDVPEEEITLQTDFVKDLQMNSYDFIRLIGQMEDDLGIEIPDDEIRDLRTVGDVADYLKSKI